MTQHISDAARERIEKWIENANYNRENSRHASVDAYYAAKAEAYKDVLELDK